MIDYVATRFTEISDAYYAIIAGRGAFPRQISVSAYPSMIDMASYDELAADAGRYWDVPEFSWAEGGNIFTAMFHVKHSWGWLNGVTVCTKNGAKTNWRACENSITRLRREEENDE